MGEPSLSRFIGFVLNQEDGSTFYQSVNAERATAEEHMLAAATSLEALSSGLLKVQKIPDVSPLVLAVLTHGHKVCSGVAADLRAFAEKKLGRGV